MRGAHAAPRDLVPPRAKQSAKNLNYEIALGGCHHSECHKGAGDDAVKGQGEAFVCDRKRFEIGRGRIPQTNWDVREGAAENHNEKQS
jgi:hypothetical protein